MVMPVVPNPSVPSPAVAAPTGAQPVDPELMQRVAAGMAAQGRARQLQGGSRMAQALRQANTELAPMTGSGYSAQAANPLQALATIMQRRKGRQDLANIDTEMAQANEQAQAGEQARFGMAQAMQDRGFAENRASAESARADRRSQIQKVEEWEDSKGNAVNIGMTAGGPINTDTGQPISLDGLSRKVPDKYKSGGMGRLPAKQKSLAVDAYKRIEDLSDLQTIGKGFTQKDMDSLNRPAVSVFVKAMTPTAFENYVNENQKNWSPRVKRFMGALNKLGAEQRHAIFGAALTAREGSSAESFIANAQGLNLDSLHARLDTEYEGNVNRLSAIDRLFGSELVSNTPEYELYTLREDGKPKLEGDAAPSGDVTPVSDFDYSGYTDEQAADDREYFKLTGTHLDMGVPAKAAPKAEPAPKRNLPKSREDRKALQDERRQERKLKKAAAKAKEDEKKAAYEATLPERQAAMDAQIAANKKRLREIRGY